MSYMPPEIIGEILSWLPVKSLLSFRSVSKEWLSLIDSKQFIKQHSDNSAKTNFNGTLVFHSYNIFYIDSDSFQSSQLHMRIPRIDGYTVVSSCNGLVLLLSNSDDHALWNPSTRKLNKLPRRPLGSSSVYHPYPANIRRFALGYDSKHDDYKVVTVLHPMVPTSVYLSSETMIYSLKSNSWKRIPDFPYGFYNDLRWCVYHNDALHALRRNSDSSADIIAFDFVNETHYDVPKPKFIALDISLLSMKVLRGCLALIAGNLTSMEIWVMNEYGVKESWSKLLCFESPTAVPCCPSLLAYSKSGDEILLNSHNMFLQWYDLKKKTFRMAFTGRLSGAFDPTTVGPLFDAEFCIGSLVSPFSPAELESAEENRQ